MASATVKTQFPFRTFLGKRKANITIDWTPYACPPNVQAIRLPDLQLHCPERHQPTADRIVQRPSSHFYDLGQHPSCAFVTNTIIFVFIILLDFRETILTTCLLEVSIYKTIEFVYGSWQMPRRPTRSCQLSLPLTSSRQPIHTISGLTALLTGITDTRAATSEARLIFSQNGSPNQLSRLYQKLSLRIGNPRLQYRSFRLMDC